MYPVILLTLAEAGNKALCTFERQVFSVFLSRFNKRPLIVWGRGEINIDCSICTLFAHGMHVIPSRAKYNVLTRIDCFVLCRRQEFHTFNIVL